MDDYRREWERYETRRKVLLAFMIMEFLIPFGLLGEPVSNYVLGGRYVWFVGFVVWAVLAGFTILLFGQISLSSLREEDACPLQKRADQVRSLRADRAVGVTTGNRQAPGVW